mmetsp:Transcript_5765/g.21961  ORF Transcript_5765/g.21961 Transcript_5765/m.21961 type:complete len:272 (+) Transcript_5765:1627-2442(+)
MARATADRSQEASLPGKSWANGVLAGMEPAPLSTKALPLEDLRSEAATRRLKTVAKSGSADKQAEADESKRPPRSGPRGATAADAPPWAPETPWATETEGRALLELLPPAAAPPAWPPAVLEAAAAAPRSNIGQALRRAQKKCSNCRKKRFASMATSAVRTPAALEPPLPPPPPPAAENAALSTRSTRSGTSPQSRRVTRAAVQASAAELLGRTSSRSRISAAHRWHSSKVCPSEGRLGSCASGPADTLRKRARRGDVQTNHCSAVVVFNR